MLRREEVRDSCSVRLCVRRASVVAVEMPVLVAAGVRSSACRADVVGFLARSSVVVEVVGVIVDWGGGGWDSCGEVSGTAGRGGVIAPRGEGVALSGETCEVWESVSSEGVSSPKRSSPSELSSSSSPSCFSSAIVLQMAE
jgi:hypothetical protein